MSTTSPQPGGTLTVGGRTIPRIGYGAGSLTRAIASGRTHGDAVEVLRAAYDLGVRHFDTAQFYGDGLANSLLREAFEGIDDVFLATKVGARPRPGMPPMEAAQHPQQLREAVDDNLTSLGVERLDLVYLRRMDMPPGVVAQGDEVADLDDQLAELVRLRQAGKIAAIGLSHVSLPQMEAALPSEIVAVSNSWSVVQRDDEPLLHRCVDAGIAWAPYHPLGGGFANLPRAEHNPVVQKVATEAGAAPRQVAQAWLLAHAPNTLLISGTASAGHVRENITAGEVVLRADQLAELDAVDAASAGA